MADVDRPARRMTAAALRGVAPSLRGYTDDVLLGAVWERPGLGKRERSLVTVAALVAQQRDRVLKRHIGRALDNGVEAGEIVEIATHLAFYAGWPAAVGAIQSIRVVLSNRGLMDAETVSEAIENPLTPTEPRGAEGAGSALDFVAFDGLSEEGLLADLWERPTLGPGDRSLCTLAALVAAGDLSHLVVHAERGVSDGLTLEAIAEAITHLAFYVGWPKAAAAATALKVWRAEIGAGRYD